MGNQCRSSDGTSRFTVKYFVDKYGEDAVLNLLKQNMKKQMMLNKIPEMSQKYKKRIHKCKIQSVRQINLAEDQILSTFVQSIKTIEKQHPGLVTKAEVKYEKCAEQILGRKDMVDSFNKLRKSTIDAYENEQTHTEQTIRRNLQSHIQKLQKKKKENFQQFNTITQDERKTVRQGILRKYKKQTQEFKKQISKQIQQGTALDVKTNYDHLHPEKDLQELRAISRQLKKDGQIRIVGRQLIAGLHTRDMNLPPVGCWAC